MAALLAIVKLTRLGAVNET